MQNQRTVIAIAVALLALIGLGIFWQQWRAQQAQQSPLATRAGDSRHYQALKLDNGLEVILVADAKADHGGWYFSYLSKGHSELGQMLSTLDQRRAMAMGGEIRVWPGDISSQLSLSFSPSHTEDALQLLDDLLAQQPSHFSSRGRLVLVSPLDLEQQHQLLPARLGQMRAQRASPKVRATGQQNNPWAPQPQLHLPLTVTATEQQFLLWWFQQSGQASAPWLPLASVSWLTEEQMHIELKQRPGSAVTDFLASIERLQHNFTAALASYEQGQQGCNQSFQANSALELSQRLAHLGQAGILQPCPAVNGSELSAKLAQMPLDQLSWSNPLATWHLPSELPSSPRLDAKSDWAYEKAQPLRFNRSQLFRSLPEPIWQAHNGQIWHAVNEELSVSKVSWHLGWQIQNAEQQQLAYWLSRAFHTNTDLHQQLQNQGIRAIAELNMGHFYFHFTGPRAGFGAASSGLQAWLSDPQALSQALGQLRDETEVELMHWLAMGAQQPRTAKRPAAQDWLAGLAQWFSHSPQHQLWYGDLYQEQALAWGMKVVDTGLESVTQSQASYPHYQALAQTALLQSQSQHNQLGFWQLLDDNKESASRQLLLRLIENHFQDYLHQRSTAVQVQRWQPTDGLQGLVTQGEIHPGLQELQLNRFLNEFWQQLQDTSSQDYLDLQQGLAMQQKYRPWANHGRAEHYWHSILQNDHHFLLPVRRSEALLLVSKDNLVRSLDQIRRNESPSLWVHQWQANSGYNASQARGNRSQWPKPEAIFEP